MDGGSCRDFLLAEYIGTQLVPSYLPFRGLLNFQAMLGRNSPTGKSPLLNR